MTDETLVDSENVEPIDPRAPFGTLGMVPVAPEWAGAQAYADALALAKDAYDRAVLKSLDDEPGRDDRTHHLVGLVAVWEAARRPRERPELEPLAEIRADYGILWIEGEPFPDDAERLDAFDRTLADALATARAEGYASGLADGEVR